MDGLKEVINKITPVTRYFMGITLLMSFCVTYQIVTPYALILDFTSVFSKLQIWRLFTSFFFVGAFSMNFLFSMMMIYYTLNSIEAYFQNKEADMAVLLGFNAIFVMPVAWLAGEHMVLHSPYLFSLMYVWCKLVPDQQISIWGFPVQSKNLPWVLIAMHIFTGGSPFGDLVGVAVGHMFYFLKYILPVSHGKDYLKTPNVVATMVKTLKERGQQRGDNMRFVNNRGGENMEVNRNPNNRPDGQGNGRPAFRPFAGGGVRIGGQ